MVKQFTVLKQVLEIYVYIQISTQVEGTQLSREIKGFCPFSDICNRTASRTLDNDGLVPCCLSCRCDEDCGLRSDCCFDHLDKYELIEKGRIACTDPRIRKHIEEEVQSVFRGYFMIQTCGKRTSDKNKEHEIGAKCRLSDEFGNSLISPVSSQETNLIYVNKQCAACNGLNTSRIKKWNYLFISGVKHQGAAVTSEIVNVAVNELGTLVYLPPAGENWSDKRCTEKYVDVEHCNTSGNWLYLCRELRAPFQWLEKMYKNVFCALCDGAHSQNIEEKCQQNQFRRPFSESLTVLLNSAIIDRSTLLNVRKVTEMAKSETYCPGHKHNLKNTCLPIYCPEGMLKSKEGCSYYALKWYTPAITMQLKLIPIQGTRLLVSRLRKFGTIERTNPFTWLKIPCRKITMVQVYYSSADNDYQWLTKDNETDEYVTTFIVRIWKMVDMKTGIDPSDTIPMFYKCVRKQWLANIGKETYTFDAYFDKYSDYVQDGTLKLKKWSRVENIDEDFVRPALYMPISQGPNNIRFRQTSIIPLQKLFFCKQVRIPVSDIDLEFGEIRIRSKNITLGTNEYLVNSPAFSINDVTVGDWNKTTFSVCIEDYDPSFVISLGYTTHPTFLFRLLFLYMLFAAHSFLTFNT